MGYLNEGQAERTSAAGSTFTNGPLGLASSSAGLLSPTTYYVRDPGGGLIGQRTTTSSHYYLFDRLGSVVALTDAAGNAVNRYVYEPYGNRLTGTAEAVVNPWQFAGGFRDAFSGYVKFGERYYDPTVGRWTQRDPSGQDANSYGYAGANPVNFVDVTGLKGSEPSKTFKSVFQAVLQESATVSCKMLTRRNRPCEVFGAAASTGFAAMDGASFRSLFIKGAVGFAVGFAAGAVCLGSLGTGPGAVVVCSASAVGVSFITDQIVDEFEATYMKGR